MQHRCATEQGNRQGQGGEAGQMRQFELTPTTMRWRLSLRPTPWAGSLATALLANREIQWHGVSWPPAGTDGGDGFPGLDDVSGVLEQALVARTGSGNRCHGRE